MEFLQIPIESFIGKVFRSEEKVMFSYVDAYGHLNSAKYLEIVTNHRVLALEEQIQCFTLDILKSTGVALVIAKTELNYLKPSFQSETLVVESWVENFGEYSFPVEFQVFEKTTRQLRCVGNFVCVSVDLKTHKPCSVPSSLPTRGKVETILGLPNASECRLERAPEKGK